MKPGLILEIVGRGLERRELAREFMGAEVGPGRIPYEPKSLAAIITLTKSRGVQSYTPIEANLSGARFLAEQHKLPVPEDLPLDEEKLRKILRTMGPADLFSIDPRSLPISLDEIWKYLEGGTSAPPEKFGKGRGRDYGFRKLKPDSMVIIHRSTTEAQELWFKLRARYHRMYQSDTVGMVHL